MYALSHVLILVLLVCFLDFSFSFFRGIWFCSMQTSLTEALQLGRQLQQQLLEKESKNLQLLQEMQQVGSSLLYFYTLPVHSSCVVHGMHEAALIHYLYSLCALATHSVNVVTSI